MYSVEQLLHHLHIEHPHRRPNGLEALALNFAISQLATGMISVFGVLFIYQLGESLMEGLMLVWLFFGMQRVVVGGVAALVARLIAKVGYRWMMFVGLGSLAMKAWLLMQVGRSNMWLLIPALILGGVAIAGYYLGYHGIFLNDNDEMKIGKQIGLITMIGRLAIMVSPVLAGFLVERFSFTVMFGVAMSLLIVSLGPLFLMSSHEDGRQGFSYRQAVGLLKKKSGFLDSTIWWHIGNAIQTFFWPVLLFLIMGSYIKFGLVGSGVMVVNSLAVYVAGKLYDRRKLRRYYPMITGVVALSNVMRYMSRTMVMAVGADGLNRLANPFWWMKIRRNALIDGERYRAMVFAVAWEWAVTIGYLIGLVIGFVILWQTNGGWGWLAVPAVVSNLVAAVGVRKDE